MFYEMIKYQGDLPKVFWDRDDPDKMGFPEFWNLFNPNENRYLICALSKDRLVAILTVYMPSHRIAYYGGWASNQHRGYIRLAVFKKVLSMIHIDSDIPYLYSLSPWRHVKKFCERVGMEQVGLFPGYCHTDSGERDVHVMMSTKDKWIKWLSEFERRKLCHLEVAEVGKEV